MTIKRSYRYNTRFNVLQRVNNDESFLKCCCQIRVLKATVKIGREILKVKRDCT